MPLLVAQQCSVLRRFSTAISTSWRSQRLPRTATYRAYTQQIIPSDNATRRPKPPHSAIIIPASVAHDPSDLIDRIAPVAPRRRHIETFCVFFVTPTFAHWLSKDDSFLEKAINRLYGTSHRQERKEAPEVHAVCAVVDKLPASRIPRPDSAVEENGATRNTWDVQVASLGFEGIAYVTLPPTGSLGSRASSSTENGAIEIVVGEHFTDDRVIRDTVRLPLANTVFQTGTSITMLESKWKAPLNDGPFILTEKRNIAYQGLRISGRNSPSAHIETSLSIPLLPLTVPRDVGGCMGNIIRRVIGADGKSVTASSELEDVVPRFYRSRAEPAQTTTAWALVIPQEMKEAIIANTNELLAKVLANSGITDCTEVDLWDLLWRSDPPMSSTMVSQAVADGARLHRVLSGGGGWGKKAGILSLDPVPVTKDADTPSSGTAQTLLDDPEDFASTLIPVVRDGDLIQFFITPTAYLASEAGRFDNVESLDLSSGRIVHGWQLGTVPSTMDSFPGQSWQHSPSATKDVYLFKHSFGALVEGGLTFTRQSRLKGDDSNHGVPFQSHRVSMVDVPFSRFWAVNMVEQQRVHEDVSELDVE